MNKNARLFLTILILLSIFIPVSCAYDLGATTKQYSVIISISESNLKIEENIRVINDEYENITSLRFWIQQNADDIEILFTETGEYLSPKITGNTYECDLNEYNFTLMPEESIDIRLTYSLPTETKHFDKTFLYDSDTFELSYNDNELYLGENIRETYSLQILLHQPTEAPVNIFYILIIFILVIILIATTLFLMRKQRKKAKQLIVDSKETLETKKALLLSVLKDIEKKHRGKDISDDTYHKLKEEYKQQAVDVMKKMDDKK